MQNSVQLNSYLGENYLHEPLQSASKIFHSTETALLTVTNDIMLSLDKGENARGGTLGFSGLGCAAGILEPLTYTRASSAEFCYPILE